MTMHTDDLLIRGGRVMDPANGIDAVLDVWIRNGRVAQVAAGIQAEEPTLEARGLVVTPGFIDLHAHLREPGEEHKETVATGVAAAARGGFTTICAMPNTHPTMDTPAVVAQVLAAAQRAGGARVLPVGAITKSRAGVELAEMADLRAAGVVAFSDDGRGVASGTIARRALEYASDLGLPIAEHCEEPSLADGGVMHDGAVAARLGLRGQPSVAEAVMAERDLRLASLTGARLHLCHISTRETCEAIVAAKARGLPVSAEVTPHHLFLTDAIIAGQGEAPGGLTYDTNAKVNPPLRSADDVAACIEALRDGVIDAIATDHAPHAIVDKACEFDQAAFGISGLETAFGVLGTLVARGTLDLPTVIKRLTIGAVRAWGIDRDDFRGLGTLTEGAPGDVTLLSPAAAWTVDVSRFASKGKNTPLAGISLTGRVVATVCGGRVLFEGRDG